MNWLERYAPLYLPPDVGGASPGGADTGSTPLPSSGGDAASPGISDAGTDDGSFALGDDFLQDSTDDVIQAEPTPAQEPGPQPTAPTVAPQQAAPQVPTVVPTAQQPEGQPPPAVPGREVPSAQPLSPQSLLAQVLQNKDALLGHLAQNRFQLSKAEVDAMEQDAVGQIPKLLARTYFEAYTSAVNFVNNFVPRMIEGFIDESNKDRAAEDNFFTAWPGLDRAKHGNDVMQFANAYRQLNPKASLEDAIRFVGTAVAAKHGVANAGAKPPSSANGRAAGPRRGPPPFAPSAGSRTPPMTSQTEVEPFAGLGVEFD